MLVLAGATSIQSLISNFTTQFIQELYLLILRAPVSRQIVNHTAFVEQFLWKESKFTTSGHPKQYAVFKLISWVDSRAASR